MELKYTSCYLNLPWAFLDIATIIYSSSITYLSLSPFHLVCFSFLILPYIINFRNRWTMTVPMLPFLILQLIRNISGARFKFILLILSVGCISTSALLSFLFPTVKLHVQKGKYDVGVTDLFLPLEDEIKMTYDGDDTLELNNYVNVRVLYPTTSKTSISTSRSFRKRLKNKIRKIRNRNENKISYIDHDISKQYLSQMIKLAPVPLIKFFTWILYYWRLISLPISSGGKLISAENKLPIVVFSHGLFGSCHLYSYQGYHLASEGKLVVMVNHLDGSAPIAKKYEGSSSSLVPLDTGIFDLWREKKVDEYTERRRMQTNFRSNELLSALISILRINQGESIINTNKSTSCTTSLTRTTLHSWGTHSGVQQHYQLQRSIQISLKMLLCKIQPLIGPRKVSVVLYLLRRGY